MEPNAPKLSKNARKKANRAAAREREAMASVMQLQLNGVVGGGPSGSAQQKTTAQKRIEAEEAKRMALLQKQCEQPPEQGILQGPSKHESIQFALEVAARIGHPIHTQTTTEMNARTNEALCRQQWMFDHMPYFVFGTSGTGCNRVAAELSAANNLLNFFTTGFIDRQTYNDIKRRGARSTNGVDQVVAILTKMEKMLNKPRFNTLLTACGMFCIATHEEKKLSKLIQNEVRHECTEMNKAKKAEQTRRSIEGQNKAAFIQPAEGEKEQEQEEKELAPPPAKRVKMEDVVYDYVREPVKGRVIAEVVLDSDEDSDVEPLPNGSSLDLSLNVNTAAPVDPSARQARQQTVQGQRPASAQRYFEEEDEERRNWNGQVNQDDFERAADELADEQADDDMDMEDGGAGGGAGEESGDEGDVAAYLRDNGMARSRNASFLVDPTGTAGGEFEEYLEQVERQQQAHLEKYGFEGENGDKRGRRRRRDAVLDFSPAACLPSNYEDDLLGIECNVAALPISKKMREYRIKFPEAFEVFNDKIWSHYKSNGQDDETYAWKMQARQLLHDEIAKMFPGMHCQMFAVGSTVNGCGSYNSDMDVCMTISDPRGVQQTERSYAVNCLRKAQRALRSPALKPIMKTYDVIPAKVPIIKMELKGRFDGLEIDMNVNNTPGIYNSHLIHYYSRVDDRFPALALLVKHWAIVSGINDAMTGTFNSYSLIVLVIHFLQCAVRPAVLPNLQALYPEKFATQPLPHELSLFEELDPPLPERPLNEQSVGELLCAFFHYYADFDFNSSAISIRNGCVYSRERLPGDTAHFYIFLEEPYDGKNTARCVTRAHNMQTIRAAFCRAKRMLDGSKPPDLASIGVSV